MRALASISLAVLGCSFFTNPSFAQVTNLWAAFPATKLESFETNVGVVILKATTELGRISANAGEVAVKCREITDTSTGHKEQGIAIEITQRDRLKDTMLIDYDEIPSLSNGIDYLNNLDMNATSLNALDAVFTTKGGFRIAALGTRGTGVIQFGVRDTRTGSIPIILSRPQMTQLSFLLDKAKAMLDALRK